MTTPTDQTTAPTDQTTAPVAVPATAPADQGDTTEQAGTPFQATANLPEPPARPGRLTRIQRRIGAAIANWWGFVAEPMSVREAWQESGRIVAHRIPADSKLLAFLWAADNHTGRPFLFTLLGILPTWANGPLLWCAARPSRRLGLYVVILLLLLIPRWVS